MPFKKKPVKPKTEGVKFGIVVTTCYEIEASDEQFAGKAIEDILGWLNSNQAVTSRVKENGKYEWHFVQGSAEHTDSYDV